MRAIRRFVVRTVLPESLADLDTLARNLRWSWHAPTRELFESIDADLWHASGEEPIAFLGGLTTEQLATFAQDELLVERVNRAVDDLQRYLTEPRWYQDAAAVGQRDLPKSIAYFSPEFGITAALPQYSGGLGILAGDHLKSASDLGVPIVGVGLLYGAGYFRQSLTREGWQVETYPVYDPAGLPLTLLRNDDGSPALVKLNLPGDRVVHAQVWRADVGRVPLLLLDSNVHENDDVARGITDRLYGGTGEHRLQQELLLGVGGVRALRLFSQLTGAPTPEVYHTNEGHAGFLGVERIGELIEQGLSFDEALEAVRAGTLFTTHTPVPAGIDRFPIDLVRAHFSSQRGAVPGVPEDRVLALGLEDYDGGDPTVFNMAVMGLRLAQRANGVSRLHGAVSRGMFAGLWPNFDVADVPITSVTNGIHSPTWVDHRMRQIAAERLRHDPLLGDSGWERRDLITDDELWEIRRTMRKQLVLDVRQRVRASWVERGASPAELGWIDDLLDPDVLTIGFARRVPTYKRLTLMLRDPQRLRDALLHPEHPVQLIVAGKSHPADEHGKQLIQQLVNFADDPAVRHRIVFLPDYDIGMALRLYPGCDVWLNNPLRPLEACGTSGMKAALNGGLNLSILDGWWAEWAEDGRNGWVIPSADGVTDPDRRDDLEANALYDLLEQQVAPRFYHRDSRQIPVEWLGMVRYTLETLGPKVQATRMVAEYVERLYAPAAHSARTLAANDDAGARELAAWKNRVRGAWSEVRVDHVESQAEGTVAQQGDQLAVRAYVSLGQLSPADVAVQLMYGRAGADDQIVDGKTLELAHETSYEDGRHLYTATITLDRTGSFGYGVRVVPSHPALASVAEVGCVANAH